MAALVDKPTKLAVGTKVKTNPEAKINHPPNDLIGKITGEIGPAYDYTVKWPTDVICPDLEMSSQDNWCYKAEWLVPVEGPTIEATLGDPVPVESAPDVVSLSSISFEEMLKIFQGAVGNPTLKPGAKSPAYVEPAPKAWVYKADGYGSDKAPETQKAKGLTHLRSLGLPTLNYVVVRDEEGVKYAFMNSSGFMDYEGYTFARPAPTRPRHGFVESRKVKGSEAAIDVLREALKEDPKAELILMPPVDAQLNIVWTPSLLTIGAGHDGATSGRDVVVLPQGSEWIGAMGLERRMKDAGVGVGDDPYFEVVVDEKGATKFVQLRAGPKVEARRDYIPQTMEVTRVIQVRSVVGEEFHTVYDPGANTDRKVSLLEWEKMVTDLPEGTVVHHPGGSITSHVGAHCLINKVPIMISREPSVGEVLDPTFVLAPYNREAALDGLVAGFMTPLHKLKEAPDYDQGAANAFHSSKINHICWAAHNAGLLRGDDSYQIGYAMALILRYGSAACMGEARHAKVRTPREREDVYNMSFRSPFGGRHGVSRAHWIFKNYPWHGHGYGGKKWQNCTEATMEVDQCIREFIHGERDVEGLASGLNLAVDQAHNGGWWLNKWADTATFNNAAYGNPIVAARAGLSIWEGEQLRREGKVFEVGARVVSIIGKWADHKTWEPDPKTIEVIRLREDETRRAKAAKAAQQEAYEAAIAKSQEKKMKASMKMTAPVKAVTSQGTAEISELVVSGDFIDSTAIVTTQVVPIEDPVVYAQYRWTTPETVHIQYQTQLQMGGKSYKSLDLNVNMKDPYKICPSCSVVLNGKEGFTIPSMAGSEQKYKELHTYKGNILASPVDHCGCHLVGGGAGNKHLIQTVTPPTPIQVHEAADDDDEEENEYTCTLCGEGCDYDDHHVCDHCGEVLCQDCDSDECCPQPPDEDEDEDEEEDDDE